MKARDEIYGFLDYDKKVLNLIYSLLNKKDDKAKILDICAGTGFPYISELLKNEYTSIFANDISFSLIAKAHKDYKCRCINSNISSVPFKKKKFNLIICLHSSWYFSDVFTSINNLIHLSNKYILIDFQNANCLKFYLRHLYSRFSKIIIRFVNNLRHFLHRRYDRIIWDFYTESRPTDMKRLIPFIKTKSKRVNIYNPELKTIDENKINSNNRILMLIEV